MGKMTALMDEAATVTRKQLKYLVEAFFRTHPSYAFELKYDFPEDADLPVIHVSGACLPALLLAYSLGLVSWSEEGLFS
jgi:hypothetical protein